MRLIQKWRQFCYSFLLIIIGPRCPNSVGEIEAKSLKHEASQAAQT